MEDAFFHTMLLDCYGELLTDKQRECCDLRYNQDLSLQEISEQIGGSRQAAWDNIHRAELILTEFEEKTGMVKKTLERRELLRKLRNLLETDYPDCAGNPAVLSLLDKLSE